MNVACKTITAGRCKDNRNAIDWGPQGFLAYGCHSAIVIVDVANLQIIQVLDRIKSPVTKILWDSNRHPKTLNCGFKLRIVSGDKAGAIVLWDVFDATVITELTFAVVSHVLDLCWLPNGIENLLLLVLYASKSIILWNLMEKARMWTVNFTEPNFCMAVDVFSYNKLILLANSTLTILTDVDPNHLPTVFGKYTVLEPDSETPDQRIASTSLLSARLQLLKGEKNKPNLNEERKLLQTFFCPFERLCFGLVYLDRISFFDSELLSNIGTFLCDKNLPPFVKIFPAWRKDRLICLHDGATISICARKDSIKDNQINVSYEILAVSDPFKFPRNCRISSYIIDLYRENCVAVITEDSKLFCWNISEENELLKIRFHGSLRPLTSSPMCIKAFPFHDLLYEDPLLLVGSSDGEVFVLNTDSGMLVKMFDIHSSAVKGIEWINPDTFLSWSDTADSREISYNEICLTNIKTGRSKAFCNTMSSIKKPIMFIQISDLRQYCIVAYQNEPFEIWDIRTLTLIQTIPKKSSKAITVAWLPSTGSSISKFVKTFDFQFFSGPSIEDLSYEKEQFFSVDEFGVMYHFTLDEHCLISNLKIATEASLSTLSAVAWKMDIIVLADTAGHVCIWNLKSKLSRTVTTNNGRIYKIAFSKNDSSAWFLVLASHVIELWDGKSVNLISKMSLPSYLRMIDCDWASFDKPLFCSSDGCIRISDFALGDHVSSVLFRKLEDPIFSPYLIPANKSLSIYYSLLGHCLETEIANGHKFCSDEISKIPSEILQRLASKESGLEKMFYIADVFGDVCAFDFISLLLHIYKGKPFITGVPFVRRFLLTKTEFINSEIARCNLNGPTTDDLILLGCNSEAVVKLIGTPVTKDSFYINCLRACLLESAQECTEQMRSTVKIAATNLIAAGSLNEGVELLCMCNCITEACRYLQDHGNLQKATTLALARLDDNGKKMEVIKKLAEYLSSEKKYDGLLLWVIIRQWSEVIRFFLPPQTSIYVPLIAFVMEELMPLNLFSNEDELVKMVLTAHSAFWSRLGNKEAACYYAELAGCNSNPLNDT